MLDQWANKISPCPVTGCWWWTGGTRGPDSRAQARFKGKPVAVARVALAEKLGRDLNGCALHTCDQALCVNPDHLYEGTQQDNIRDMLERGRYRPKALNKVCLHGHKMEGSNVMWKGGRRDCRECVNARQRAAYAARKGE